MNRKGFTLIELMVVIMIIGILASMGIPYYRKTIETSKATDALTLANMIGNANKMNFLDTGQYTSGTIDNTCNTANCGALANNNPCRLIACNYVSKNDWSASKYNFYACNPGTGAGGAECCAVGSVSCTNRKNETTPYDNWGYRITEAGGCLNQPDATTPACPTI
ncbi:MAG: pilin [Elusimicrobia bacterium]|nr:pilin [Elusimicrobiota bacterium]